MSLTTRNSKTNSGFSLIEVLVALAIAATLSATLTRMVGSTRSNAKKIGELIDMMTLSQDLLEELPADKLRQGKVDGHRAGFNWHLEIEPAAYAARALKSSASFPATAAAGVRTSLVNLKGPDASIDKGKQGLSKNEAAEIWAAYRILLVVQAPSGRRHVADTIRIGRRAANEKQE